MSLDTSPVDLVGIGFGPSNLALAITVAEHNETHPAEPLRAHFYDNKDSFAWHPDMLLPGAQMQVSFLKDLVTLRNPQSRFTFINYLCTRGRLVDFINHQTFFPSRAEFSDYLGWAAGQVEDKVTYDTSVTQVEAVGDEFLVHTRDQSGSASTVRARNVVVGGGISAVLPEQVSPSVRQWHSHGLLGKLEELPELTHHRFVVVGAGQSAAEITTYLHDAYPDAQVHAVFGKYGYTPADDSPYANRVFDPEAVDDFHEAPIEVRQRLLDYHRSTNYSAVDSEVIAELYAREYQEKVQGNRRLFVHGASRLDSEKTEETSDGVRVTINHLPTTTTQTLTADAVVYATGFRSIDLRDLLAEPEKEYCFDDSGLPQVARDYRIRRPTAHEGNVYLNGGVEHSHGLTATLLSNLAIRSADIVDSIVGAPQD
ncbi:lysine N(6)-hydroxylase/L-ornithine N(5)-oxygenase family protein [Gordonia rubripertincta]|uniref:L-lysine N6-monooxygenase MbtG n=1 Tax=Gordonia rubripertincta TaxID=36822 RepID=A0ABT4MRP5_GORRU|nr:SidA/IucD/PvdA family monooxygenase [Gordonia rubripertincta]MCZ4549325.1 SidA/IucD/PvdA family monooxygenase [Gordonia rubripertincta]